MHCHNLVDFIEAKGTQKLLTLVINFSGNNPLLLASVAVAPTTATGSPLPLLLGLLSIIPWFNRGRPRLLFNRNPTSSNNRSFPGFEAEAYKSRTESASWCNESNKEYCQQPHGHQPRQNGRGQWLIIPCVRPPGTDSDIKWKCTKLVELAFLVTKTPRIVCLDISLSPLARVVLHSPHISI